VYTAPLTAALLIALWLVPVHARPPYRQTGIASWYGHESGKVTANDERWNPHNMTAASMALNFNTRVKVTHLRNGKSVIVRINDRGPSKRLHRIIDLSQAAATRIGMKNSGIARVLVEELRLP
jgi:rare lipoprotein A